MKTYNRIELSEKQFNELRKKERVVICRGIDGKNITFHISVSRTDQRHEKLIKQAEVLKGRLAKLTARIDGGKVTRRKYSVKTCTICGRNDLKNLGHHMRYAHQGVSFNLPGKRSKPADLVIVGRV